MMTTEQIVASHKANVETLFGLTSKAFEGMEKLVELNLTATKAALSESAQSTKAALSVKDAQELMALQANLFQPLAEKTAAYSRHLYDIASGTSSEFTKALEAQTAAAHKRCWQRSQRSSSQQRLSLCQQVRWKWQSQPSWQTAFVQPLFGLPKLW